MQSAPTPAASPASRPQPTNIYSADAAVRVPGMGTLPRNAFWILIGMSLLGLTGFIYVGLELLQSQRQMARTVKRGFNPYISGQPVRRADMFFGRHSLLQRIVDTLHNNSIMIHGERRIGKTTLLHQLASRLTQLEDPGYWFVPVYIDLEGTEQAAFFHVLMEEILHRIAPSGDEDAHLGATLQQLTFHDSAIEEYGDRHFNRDLQRVVRALQDYTQQRHPGKRLRLILLMDEMDVVSQYDRLIQQQLRRIFMRNFATALGAVVAGIEINRAWDRVESPWYNLFNEVAVPPFNREAALELLLRPVQDIYTYDAAALEQIIEHSDGRPFRLQQYALEAVAHMQSQNRRRVTLADVAHAHRAIEIHNV